MDDTADKSTEVAGNAADVETKSATDTTAPTSSTAAEPSLSLRSKQRSESFKKGTISTGQLSPGLPIDASAEVHEIHRTQVTRIQELEAENQNLQSEQTNGATKIQKLEDELQTYKDNSSKVSELETKASLADTRAKEIENLVRGHIVPSVLMLIYPTETRSRICTATAHTGTTASHKSTSCIDQHKSTHGL